MEIGVDEGLFIAVEHFDAEGGLLFRAEVLDEGCLERVADVAVVELTDEDDVGGAGLVEQGGPGERVAGTGVECADVGGREGFLWGRGWGWAVGRGAVFRFCCGAAGRDEEGDEGGGYAGALGGHGEYFQWVKGVVSYVDPNFSMQIVGGASAGGEGGMGRREERRDRPQMALMGADGGEMKNDWRLWLL